MFFPQLRRKSFQFIQIFRYNSTKKKYESLELNKLRNIGILAHIDAGKTTTTERMLYYSGVINKFGDVHHGNTVTDFMEQERERGITIKSAAVTFYWKKYQLNLIDTPGHIDFTMEVEQALNVIDGIVVVLDGSAGVEAQTLTLWRQAERYKTPRIVFINKMDRRDASMEMSCQSIEEKLGVPVLRLHLPVVSNNIFNGVIDVITMERILFAKEAVTVTKISKSDSDWEKANTARTNLIDALTVHDASLAETVITSESFESVTTSDIIKALRSTTLAQKAVPVLIGSAYKNVGVQLLMDAIVTYLPSPTEFNTLNLNFGSLFCARAFKVIYDKQRGPLTFLRLYNGVLNKGQKLAIMQEGTSEQCSKLYIAYADEYQEIERVENGNIAVVAGLKIIKSGDIVSSSQSAVQKIREKILNSSQKTNLVIPDPVFFCSIEPQSLAYQNALEVALNELQREDPSLKVRQDNDTGQTVISGMGELHIEIIKDRLLKEYKLEVDLGPLQIAYQEVIKSPLTDEITIETRIGGNRQFVKVQLSVIPKLQAVQEVLKFDKKADAASNLANIHQKHLQAIRQGVVVGLLHGPKIGYPIINTEIMLHYFESTRGTSESVISATVTQLMQKMLKESGTNILEPIMYLEIVCPDDVLSSVLADLSKRRSSIENVGLKKNMKFIAAQIPLSELLGYATALRTISSGTASFSMEFATYQSLSSNDEDSVIRQVRGF